MYYKDTQNKLHFLSDEDIAAGGEKLLPVGSVAITDQQAETIQAANAPTQTVPQTITSFQAKAALLNAGLLESVTAMMATAPAFAKLAWAESTTFERHSKTLTDMAAVLGLTDAQLDSLFTYGAGVKA